MASDSSTTNPGRLKVWIAEHLTLAALLVFLVLTLACYVLLYAPEIRKISQSNRAQTVDQERQLKESYLAQLQTLEKNFSAIPQDDVQRITEIVPFEDDIPGLMASIEALARNNDIVMTGLSFSGGSNSNTAKTGVFQPITINMSIQNVNYQRFKLFLQALERNLRLFDVENLSVNPSAAQYVFSMRTYVQTKPTK